MARRHSRIARPSHDLLGHEIVDPVDAFTDSKAAYDLCHRFTSAQNSRHIDRKLFKMRELRSACIVNVRNIAGESNPADIFIHQDPVAAAF